MAASLLAGRYRLQKILSSTRMAEVWLAVDVELDRQVVVKLLAPGADRERFEREARAVAGLNHPNVVQLFDFGEEERWYTVFEYLPGGSLEERLAEVEGVTGEEVARIAGDVAAGLAHAHARGVVHRDLKPGNVLFDREGRSKIADFGIARLKGTDTLTEAGTVLGTAAYISPERGEPTTPASDVYSFGVILYRLLAGRLPFEAESALELAALHRDAEPPLISPSGDDTRSTALGALAMSALAKDPTLRPADGAALVGALDGLDAPVVATTQVLPGPVPTRRLPRRVPLLAGIAALALAACGVVAAMVLTGGPSPAPAVTAPEQSHSKPTTAPSPGRATAAPTATARAHTALPTSTARRTTSVAAPTTSAPTPTAPAPAPSTEITTEPLTTGPTTTGP